MTAYYLSLTIVATLMIPVNLFLMTPGDVENMVVSAQIMRRVSWAMLGIGHRVKDPKGHLHSGKTAVVVVNHQHSLDVLALFEIWPR